MAEEIVSQIIAEIIAEDQMTGTLRDARKKIKAFDGDVAKLNKSLTMQEKAALEAAAADKRLAKETKLAAAETRRLDQASRELARQGLKDANAATKRMAASAEKSKKSIEGLAQGMSLSAINGERLASSSMAAGAAIGAAIGGAAALAKDALDSYIKTNKRAEAANKRLSKSYENLQTAVVEFVAGQKGVEKALDVNATRLDVMTKAMNGYSSETEKGVERAESLNTSLGDQITAFRVMQGPVGAAIIAYDQFFDVQEKVIKQDMARSIKATRDALKGLKSELTSIFDKAVEGNALLDKEEARAAERRKKEQESAAKRRSAAAKRRAAEFKREEDKFTRILKAVAKKREADQIAAAKSAAASAKRIADETRAAIADAATEPIFGVSDVTDVRGASPFSVESIQQANDFEAVLMSIEGAQPPDKTLWEDFLGIFDPATTSTSLWVQETINLDHAMQDLAAGGVGVVVDAMGDYIEAMVSGTDASRSFGDAILLGFGTLMKQVGSGMIALSTAALLVETGGIFANPIAGIALGATLVAGGAVLAGIANKGTGLKSGGGGVADAKSAAGDVIDVITSRIGTGFERGRDRAGDNIQVIIGERPIRDVVVRSVRSAIVNREITSLSPAGQSL